MGVWTSNRHESGRWTQYPRLVYVVCGRSVTSAIGITQHVCGQWHDHRLLSGLEPNTEEHRQAHIHALDCFSARWPWRWSIYGSRPSAVWRGSRHPWLPGTFQQRPQFKYLPLLSITAAYAATHNSIYESFTTGGVDCGVSWNQNFQRNYQWP
jgi:hypothetical protein